MSAARRVVYYARLGRVGYAKGLELQAACAEAHRAAASRQTAGRNIVLLLEHDPVYTVGVRPHDYTVQLEDRLRALGADFHRTNRGGLITFHGPGQLVAYPILNLKDFRLGIKEYVKNLEVAIMKVCSKYGIATETSVHTGVWIGERKIAAIGMY